MNVPVSPPRPRAENLNHHLWNNHGTWFLHHTIYPTPNTKERIRRSLGTSDVIVARARRDFCLRNPLLALSLPPESMAA